MPILARQPDLHPASLLDRAAADDQARGEWVALYTLARREKELMRRLVAADIPFYAPLIARRLRSSSGRARVSYVPLFPGYVFSQVDESQRRAALATNTVARCLPIVDGRGLVEDLRAVKRLIDTERPLSPEARLGPGQDVRVRSGVLCGLEGRVVRRCGRERLVVAVQFLNQGVSVEVEDVDLERF